MDFGYWVHLHMHSYKEWFSCFEKLQDGVVYMGNDNACEITIIDTIQLKTHDESTKILSDVWYVPSMNKCLISMGELEPIGFNIVTIKDGILKVMPSKLVVMQGIRKNNLYHFQRSVIIGLATTTTIDDKQMLQIKYFINTCLTTIRRPRRKICTHV